MIVQQIIFFFLFVINFFFHSKDLLSCTMNHYIIVTKSVIIWTTEMIESTWIYHILFIVIFLIDNNNRKTNKQKTWEVWIRDTVLSLPATWPYVVKSNPSQIWPRLPSQTKYTYKHKERTKKSAMIWRTDQTTERTADWLTIGYVKWQQLTVDCWWMDMLTFCVRWLTYCLFFWCT